MSNAPQLILLIDDDDDDNFFHTHAIRKTGLTCQIDICSSGDDALDYIQNKGKYADKGHDLPQPDLIFLDINMPRVNGWEFLDEYAKLRNDTLAEPRVIIVMLTTSPDGESKKRALETPFVKDFVTKPLTKEKTVDIVTHYFSTII